jgi:hypothetical protein
MSMLPTLLAWRAVRNMRSVDLRGFGAKELVVWTGHEGDGDRLDTLITRWFNMLEARERDWLESAE